MNQKINLSGFKFSRLAICLCIAVSAGFCNKAFANVIDSLSGGGYSCQLTAWSLHNGLGGAGTTVYDDGYSNFLGGSYNDCTANCCRQFLFSEYTGTGTYIQLQFAYSGSEHYDTLPTHSHDVYIYNITTGVLYPSFVVLDYDSATFQPTIDTLPATYTSSGGVLSISYMRHGDTYGVDSPDIKGIIILHTPIQKLWIDAPPICSGSTASYNFQLHAYPDFSSIEVQTGTYDNVGEGSCTDPQQEYGLSFMVSGVFDSIYHVAWPIVTSFGGYTDYGISNVGFNGPSGSNYAASVALGEDDMNHYTINNSDNTNPADIAYYLTGAGYGTNPAITISVYDGISSYTTTAYILIAGTISDVTANPGSAGSILPGSGTPTYFAPITVSGISYPTGTPNPSFDFYDYTITGADAWTPTYSPVTRLHGGGTVNTIYIEHSLTIEPGATLGIKSGLKIEMGPGAYITVGAAATSSGVGGYFYIDTGTITAYRGCDATSPSTEHSTWSGITVAGNSSWSQGATWSTTPQGRIDIQFDTISYAVIGVQNGSTSNAGGGIRSVGTSFFYNNVEHVSLWPYHNIVGGVEAHSMENFSSCTFMNDTAAWFPCTEFMYASGITGASIQECTFTNNTGSNIDFGIYGYDASLIVNSHSNFNNFYYGINATFAAGVVGCQCTIPPSPIIT